MDVIKYYVSESGYLVRWHCTPDTKSINGLPLFDTQEEAVTLGMSQFTLEYLEKIKRLTDADS